MSLIRLVYNELTLIFDEVGHFNITRVITKRSGVPLDRQVLLSCKPTSRSAAARKDSAVHVSLSSVIHVKQRALSGKFRLAEARASHPWEGPENTFPSGF